MDDQGLVELQTAAAARAADEAAVAAGETWHGLMGRAAGHLARGVVRACGGDLYGLRVLVLAGPGNNGGDGWACAPRLRDRGALVTVCAPKGLDASMSDEAEAFRAAWRASGGRCVGGVDRLDALLADADVVIDALLGTGSGGPLRGDVGEAVRAVALARAVRGPRDDAERGATSSPPTRSVGPAGAGGAAAPTSGAQAGGGGRSSGGPDPAQRSSSTPRRGLVVVSADLPSGLDADTGEVAEGAIRADVTVTFGGPKVGLVLAPGREHVGELVVGDLGPRHVAPPTGWSLLAPGGPDRPPLAPQADKRARGRVLVVAGSADAAGAAVLATTGALEHGAGLTTAAVPDVARDRVAAARPGAMTRALPSGDDGELAPEAAFAVLRTMGVANDRAHALAEGARATGPAGRRGDEAGDGGASSDGSSSGHAADDGAGERSTGGGAADPPGRDELDVDAVVVGPGCGYGDGTAAVVRAVLALPVVRVLDADALNAFRGRPDELRSDVGVTVITPHERELARLAGTDVPAGAHARAELAARVARDLGAVVVAKGPSTVVVDPGGRRVVVSEGGPELGVGGTGDLLAGMLGAALAEAGPVEPLDAVLPAALAVRAHARAGRRAAGDHGPRPPVAAIAAAIRDA